jgi:hypothetical protein
MKTMIWKELRENARWALLACLGLLIAEIYALSVEKETIDYYSISLCGDTFLLVSAFGCCAVGAVLGALQILPELRRDQWASLLHRPIPREEILAGKMVAGLLLYAAAVGVPLLASVVYVIWPANYPAPFVPGLVLPAVSDLFLGLVFYAGALLVGLHPGRWLGTRGAMVLAAVGTLMCHLADGWPFAVPVMALIVFFAAAWGAMRHSLGQRPWISRLAFGVVILAGIQVGLLLLGLGLRAIPVGRIPGFVYTEFYIANDGTVFLQKQDGNGGSQLMDMEGKVVTDEKYVGNNVRRYSLYPFIFADRRGSTETRYQRTDRSSRFRVETIQSVFATADVWYNVEGPEPYFAGYDRLSKRLVGFCDRDGFKEPGAVRHPFSSVPQGEVTQINPHLFWIGPQVLAVDFTDHRMTSLLNVGKDRVFGALKVPRDSDHPRIAVALRSEIRICNMDGMLLFSIPYAYPADRWPMIGITAMDDLSRIFVQYSDYSTDETSVAHLDVLDGQGQRLASYTVPGTDLLPIRHSWNSRAADLLNAPVPLALLSTWNAHRQVDIEADYATGIPSTLVPEFERVLDRGELAVLGGWTLVLCAIAVGWARSAGLSMVRMIVWVVLTALFGVGGLLAYRLVTDWPVRVRCPHCARRRPVGLRTCPNCQAPWDVPTANGTEIFEAA